MQIDHPFMLPRLSRWRKTRLLRYAKKLLTAQQQIMTNTGRNMLHYTLQDHQRHERMRHYPKGDRIDRNTGAQYFYHCHRENYDSTEHGHFHCFIRYPHIPKRIKPAPLPDWDRYIDNPMTHIVAISMNRLGFPIRLFTVNRWVSSEIWYDANNASKLINQYQMTLNNNPYWQPLDQWIESLIHLFAPQITWLYNQRDEAIRRHQSNYPDQSAYDDKSIEEWSSIPINLNEQIHWILNEPV